MKTILVLVVIVIHALIVSADQLVNPPFDFTKAPTNEAERVARRAYIQERIAVRTGGKVIRPGTRAGEIVYVNCQKRADRKLLEESADYFIEHTKFNVTVKNGAFDLAKPQVQGNISLFVIDDETLPALLLAPENRWGVVNVAPLAKGRGEKSTFFDARVKKELARGFSMLCGATNSRFPNALTGGICATEQLDEHGDARLPVDVIGRFASYLIPFGVTPALETTYKKACEDGWAPMPTNKYQKVIWEQIRSEKERGPTRPITIKPPKKSSSTIMQ